MTMRLQVRVLGTYWGLSLDNIYFPGPLTLSLRLLTMYQMISPEEQCLQETARKLGGVSFLLEQTQAEGYIPSYCGAALLVLLPLNVLRLYIPAS